MTPIKPRLNHPTTKVLTSVVVPKFVPDAINNPPFGGLTGTIATAMAVVMMWQPAWTPQQSAPSLPPPTPPAGIDPPPTRQLVPYTTTGVWRSNTYLIPAPLQAGISGDRPPQQGEFSGGEDTASESIIEGQWPAQWWPSQTAAPLVQVGVDTPPSRGPLGGGVDVANLAVISAQWPAPWWSNQSAAPTAGWNVPPPQSIPQPPPQPHVIAAWTPPWYGAQVASPSLPQTQGATPPPNSFVSPTNLSIIGQAWNQSWTILPSLVKIAPVIPAVITQPFVPYPLIAIQAWTPAWTPPPAPVKIAPVIPTVVTVQPFVPYPLAAIQSWTPAWASPPAPVDVAPVIPPPVAAAPFVPNAANFALPWVAPWYGPPRPTNIAPLLLSYGDFPQAVGPVVAQESNSDGIWRTGWTLVRSRSEVSATFLIPPPPPPPPPGDVLFFPQYPIEQVLASTPPWYPAQDTRKIVQGIIPAPYLPPGAGQVSLQSTILNAWQPPWISPPLPVVIAPIIPPPQVVPVLARPLSRSVFDTWLIEPTTYITIPEPASVLAPTGDAPPRKSDVNYRIIVGKWEAPAPVPQLRPGVAPLIPPPAIAPVLSRPLPRSVSDAWVVEPTTSIWFSSAAVLAPTGDDPPVTSSDSFGIITQAWAPPPPPPQARVGVAAVTAVVIIPPVLPPLPQPQILASWPAPWYAPPAPVCVASLIPPPPPLPILPPLPQPHIAAQWPAQWWPDQSEPFGTPFTQGDQPPKQSPLSVQTRIIEAQWPATWWPSQRAPFGAAELFIPPPKTAFTPYPIALIRRWDTPWYGPPIPPVVIAPLTLVYGQQPPKNGPMGGAEDVENQLAIAQWPAIWWPSQRPAFGAAELFVPPPFIPQPGVTRGIIISMWPQPSALPYGTRLNPAWNLRHFRHAYNRKPKHGEINGYSAGERFDVVRQIPSIVPGARLVKAWITFKHNLSDLDSQAVLQKVITTYPVDQLGYIIDDGSITGVGLIDFQITEADSTTIGYTKILAYDIQLEFDNGEIVTKELGTISLIKKLTDTSS